MNKDFYDSHPMIGVMGTVIGTLLASFIVAWILMWSSDIRGTSCRPVYSNVPDESIEVVEP